MTSRRQTNGTDTFLQIFLIRILHAPAILLQCILGYPVHDAALQLIFN